ncbi:hypothetical protein H2200_008185 [Cladophialophora chaetospira]|uniref:Uncharacterized protein n=1 Tax=Cladophialophora chaetospira TaxID=386627 RepID=A0AA38X5A2_9EURO|nr:hypothetical protein H2200_008185 [Cladophialophora chaetospira]
MSYYNPNEDLYVQARRLHQDVLAQTGSGPMYKAAWSRWVEFNALHPQIAHEVSHGGLGRGFSAADAYIDRPWDEADEHQKFQTTFYWDTFIGGCPADGGFRAHIDALIIFLRTRKERLSKYRSQYGELFLVQWALYRMPHPMSKFLEWSLSREEQADLLTIGALEQHLLAWASLFDGDWAKTYYIQNRDREGEQELYPGQLRVGGGHIALFLYSKAEHRRCAYHMFKMIWHKNFELWAIRDGGISTVKDTRMTDW